MTVAALLLAATAWSAAPAADPYPDVEPQVLRSSVTWPDASWPYYRPDERLAAVKAFVPPGRDAYPRAEGGELLPPKLYGAEARYSKEDLARLKAALKAAHRYADVNNAAADGYLFEQKYGAGMGIHAHRLDLVFDDALDAAKPEFLTYALDKDSGRWQLLQLGYIRRGLTRPKFFDSPNAQGHFHDENICVAVVGAQLATRFASSPCDGPGERRIGPIWMMHLAVNVFNEKGLFADEFLYADHLSREGGSYSFFGRRLPGGKP